MRGCRFLDDLAVEQVNLTLRVLCIAIVVRHHADGRSAGVQFLEQVHHLLAIRRVEVTGRFVSKQDRGIAGNGAGHGHALLLTAGELRGIVLHAVRHADTLERLAPGGAPVDLVKLDCEGAEWELLRDVAPWQRVQQLTMEYHLADGQTLAQMRALVERAGFTVQVVMPADTFGLLVARR